MPAGTGLPEDADVRCLAAIGRSVIAGLDDGGVFLSKDSGATWKTANSGLPDDVSVQCLAASGEKLYLATPYDGMYLSTDSGTTWTKVHTDWSDRADVEFLAASGQVLLADLDGQSYLSIDGGATWTKLEFGQPDNEDVKILCFASNGARLFIGTALAGVLRSDDLGVTWKPVNSGFPSEADITGLARIGKDLFVATREWPGRGNVLLRADGRASWEPAGSGLPPETDINCLAAAGTNLVVGTDKGIFLSENRGQSWTLAGPDQPDPPRVSSIEVIGTRVFAGTDRGVFLSTNRGRTWSAANSGLPKSIRVFCFRQLGPRLFVGTSKGVFASRDHGAAWTPVNAGFPKHFRCDSLATNGKILAAGMYPISYRSGAEEDELIDISVYPEYSIFVSGDEGKNWKAVTQGLPDKFRIGCLAASEPYLLAALENYYLKLGRYSLGFFLSSDGGVSWTSDWPGQWMASPINCLLVGKTEIYAGTNGCGVWRLPLSTLKKKKP